MDDSRYRELECKACVHKSESFRCPKCGMTGQEIYVARWEAKHNATHPDNWRIPVE